MSDKAEGQKTSFEEIRYRGKPVKFPDLKVDKVVTLYLRQDEKTLDMRYKSNKEWAKVIKKPWYWRKLQWLANKTGATKSLGNSGIRWGLWFNPWYQFHRLLWRVGIYKPYRV